MVVAARWGTVCLPKVPMTCRCWMSPRGAACPESPRGPNRWAGDGCQGEGDPPGGGVGGGLSLACTFWCVDSTPWLVSDWHPPFRLNQSWVDRVAAGLMLNLFFFFWSIYWSCDCFQTVGVALQPPFKKMHVGHSGIEGHLGFKFSHFSEVLLCIYSSCWNTKSQSWSRHSALISGWQILIHCSLLASCYCWPSQSQSYSCKPVEYNKLLPCLLQCCIR